jgi:hypothetical protein
MFSGACYASRMPESQTKSESPDKTSLGGKKEKGRILLRPC